MKFPVVIFLGLMANLAHAIELTVDTYEAETAGKTVMLKLDKRV